VYLIQWTRLYANAYPFLAKYRSKNRYGKAPKSLHKSNRSSTSGARASAQKRYRRKVWTFEKRRILRGGKPRPSLARLDKLFWIKVSAPQVIDVFKPDTRVSAADFFAKLRRQSRRAGIGIAIDLRDVTSIRPTGAVMLMAEIYRISAGQPASSIAIYRPRDPVVNAVLCQIGAIEPGSNPIPETERDDVRHWRSATGVASEGEKGGTILEAYEGRLADKLTSDLYAGIVEAMTNTVHHAYVGTQGEELRRYIGRRWWALSQERDGELTIAICDLGIGIPRSLPRSSTFPSAVVRVLWKNLGLDRSDASAIKVAVELGRTSTGMQGRGRGLSEIVVAADLSKEGRVLISSNKGVFVSTGGKSYVHNHSHSIRGTLIHWTVRMTESDA
jgi:hypothetical protein